MFRRPRFLSIGLSWWVLLALFATGVFTSFVSAILSASSWKDPAWWGGWLQNFSTEMVGAIVTFVLFSQILERHQEKQKENQEVRELIHLLKVELRHNDYISARRILSELNAMKGLDAARLAGISFANSNLEGLNFELANLSGLDFEQSNMRGINLARSTLKQANLSSSDLANSILVSANLVAAKLDYAKMNNCLLSDCSLSGASLISTNLHTSDLTSADLSHANLSNSNLSEAQLIGANLSAANLTNANLTQAILSDQTGKYIRMDYSTVLPDGTKFVPELGFNQLKKYTSLDHPSFWEPTWVTSLRERQIELVVDVIKTTSMYMQMHFKERWLINYRGAIINPLDSNEMNEFSITMHQIFKRLDETMRDNAVQRMEGYDKALNTMIQGLLDDEKEFHLGLIPLSTERERARLHLEKLRQISSDLAAELNKLGYAFTNSELQQS